MTRATDLVAFVTEHPQGVTASQVEARFGPDTRRMLARLAKDGRLSRANRGVYVPMSQPDDPSGDVPTVSQSDVPKPDVPMSQPDVPKRRVKTPAWVREGGYPVCECGQVLLYPESIETGRCVVCRWSA
jgi:hypothetical protein